MNVALVGFGTVGQAVARILAARPGPLTLTHICVRGGPARKVAWVPDAVTWTDRFDDLLDPRIDTIVELIGGLNPAGPWIRQALEAGKSVVTANKQLLAQQGGELLALAAARGRHLGFEASVAGGIPVIRAVREGLAGDSLARISGILNGTCNYILTRMASARLPFAAALQEAQDKGFAEADPTDDLEGYDARAKLCILARVGLRVALSPEQVACRSIRPVSDIDFIYGERLGCTIRQVSQSRTPGRLGPCRGVGPAGARPPDVAAGPRGGEPEPGRGQRGHGRGHDLLRVRRGRWAHRCGGRLGPPRDCRPGPRRQRGRWHPAGAQRAHRRSLRPALPSPMLKVKT